MKTTIRLRLKMFKNKSEPRPRFNVVHPRKRGSKTKVQRLHEKEINKKENGDIEKIWEKPN